MSFYERTCTIIGEWIYRFEAEIIGKLQKKWPLQHAYAVVAEHKEDNEFDPRHFHVNLDTFCDQIAEEDEEEFLKDVEEIIGELSEL